MFIFERERDSMNGGGEDRERDTESEAGSRLWAVSTEPNAGLELMNCDIMTWAEVGHSTHWTTQAPCLKNSFNVYSFLRDRDRARSGEGHREKGRHRLQTLSCQHRTWCRARTQELRDHDLSQSQVLNLLSHPGALVVHSLLLISKNVFLIDYY